MWVTTRMVSTTPTTSPLAFLRGEVLMQMGVSVPEASLARTLNVVTVSPPRKERSKGQRAVPQISLWRIWPHGRPTAAVSACPVRASAGAFRATSRCSASMVRTESGMLRRMSRTLRGSIEMGTAYLGLTPRLGRSGTGLANRHGTDGVVSEGV